MRPKPEVCPGYPVEIRDTEILVDIHFYYHRGYPATREDPGSPGEVEIVDITYASGAKNEQEEEYLMPTIVAMFHHEDDDFLRLAEEYVWEHLMDEEDRR